MLLKLQFHHYHYFGLHLIGLRVQLSQRLVVVFAVPFTP